MRLIAPTLFIMRTHIAESVSTVGEEPRGRRPKVVSFALGDGRRKGARYVPRDKKTQVPNRRLGSAHPLCYQKGRLLLIKVGGAGQDTLEAFTSYKGQVVAFHEF